MKITSFDSKDVLLYCQTYMTSHSRYSELILMLLYDAQNLVVSGVTLRAVWWLQLRKKGSWQFSAAAVALCCTHNAPLHYLAERQNCLHNMFDII